MKRENTWTTAKQLGSRSRRPTAARERRERLALAATPSFRTPWHALSSANSPALKQRQTRKKSCSFKPGCVSRTGRNWTARHSACFTIRMTGRKRSLGARRQSSTRSSSHSMTGAEVRRATGRKRRSRTFGRHRCGPATTRGRGIGSTSTWGPGNGTRPATLELRWPPSLSGLRLVITRPGRTQTPMLESCCSDTI